LSSPHNPRWSMRIKILNGSLAESVAERKSLSQSPGPSSAEREAKGLRPGVQKLDLEQAIVDGLGLTNELVEPRLRQRPVPLGVAVRAVRGLRRLPVDRDAEANRRSSLAGPHDEIHVAGVEAVHDASPRLLRDGGLPPDHPLACQGPVVERPLRRSGIGVRLV